MELARGWTSRLESDHLGLVVLVASRLFRWRFVSSVSRAEVMVVVMDKMYKWSDRGWRRESGMTTEGRPGVLGRKWCDYRGKTWSSGLGYGRKRRGELGSKRGSEAKIPLQASWTAEPSFSSPVWRSQRMLIRTLWDSLSFFHSYHEWLWEGHFPLGICLLICKMRVWYLVASSWCEAFKSTLQTWCTFDSLW